jgi:FtsH-binding integral membrane protein
MTKEAISKHIRGGVEHRHSHKLLGILLALTGLFWLAKKVGWIPAAASGSSIFWPVAVIVLAVLIMFSSKHRRNKHWE